MDDWIGVDRQRTVNVWNYDIGRVGLAVEDGDNRTIIVLNESQAMRLATLLNEAVSEMRSTRKI